MLNTVDAVNMMTGNRCVIRVLLA